MLTPTDLKKRDNISNVEIIKSEINEISNFCKSKIHGLLDPKIGSGPIEETFQYDILKWIDEYDGSKRLKDYKFTKKQKIMFEYTKEQVQVRDDVFKRYGTDINALSKIVTRISNLEGQFRKVRYSNDYFLRDIYKKVGENFVKYALSN